MLNLQPIVEDKGGGRRRDEAYLGPWHCEWYSELCRPWILHVLVWHLHENLEMAIISLRLFRGSFEPPAFNLFCRFCFLDWLGRWVNEGNKLACAAEDSGHFDKLDEHFWGIHIWAFLREVVLFWWNWWDSCGDACDENENLLADRLFLQLLARKVPNLTEG